MRASQKESRYRISRSTFWSTDSPVFLKVGIVANKKRKPTGSYWRPPGAWTPLIRRLSDARALDPCPGDSGGNRRRRPGRRAERGRQGPRLQARGQRRQDVPPRRLHGQESGGRGV